MSTLRSTSSKLLARHEVRLSPSEWKAWSSLRFPSTVSLAQRIEPKANDAPLTPLILEALLVREKFAETARVPFRRKRPEN